MSKASTYQRRARDFAQREDWDGALAELHRAVAGDANNPMLHNQMGDLFLRKEDVSQACACFETAIDLYSDLGLHNNAVALCRKVIRLCPSRLEVRLRLARLRVDQELWSEATASFADYVEQLPAQNDAAVRALEERCREILESFPQAAPIAKILEKLEEARAFAAAFDIVQRLAQRAADAGDDETARRYTTKMRSLQVLVEGRGGDLPGKPGPVASPKTPPAREKAQPDQPPWVEPSTVAVPARATESDQEAAPPQGSEPERSTATASTSQIDVEASAPEIDPAPTALDPPEFDLDAAAGDPPVPEFDLDAAAGDTLVPELDFEAPQASELEREAARAGMHAPPDEESWRRPSGHDALGTEAGSTEYDLPESSLDDIAALWEPSEVQAHPTPSHPAEPVSSRSEAGHEAGVPFASRADPGPAEVEAPDSMLPRWQQEGVATGPGSTAPAPARRPAAAALPPSLRETIWVPDATCTDPELAEPREGGSVQELADVIDTFRKQMASALGDDVAARYDLGVAYYEMGLYDEALDEFDVARTSTALRERSLEMMAACMAMQGRHSEILTLLGPVLQSHEDPGLDLGLHYCMGVACEALGRRSEARQHFEAVARLDSSYRDVEMRLQRF